MKNELVAYHAVTEKPLACGSRLLFDQTHPNGVFHRVQEKLTEVQNIYAHPQNYCAESLGHHTKVALRELALEQVRARNFPFLPSRMRCLYVSQTIEEAEKWAELFLSLGRPTFSVVELKITGRIFVADANNCFQATLNEEENLALARHYWQNLPNLQKDPPIREILADGEIEVTKILWEIKKNGC